MAMAAKVTLILNVTLCSLVGWYRHFGGGYRIHT